MSPQTFMTVMAMLLVVMAWYAHSSKRDKIYCTLRRVNKTKITKWCKMKSRYIIVDGKRFDIVPSCVTWQWWCAGIVHMVFPQFVATLDFIYNNRFPIDPYTGKPAVISPEVLANMNKEEWVKSYYRGATPQSKMQRQNMIAQYLPWAAIILIVLVAVYFNSKMTGFGAILDQVINKVNSMAK